MTATIFPTGTTIYNPEKCWNGFTVYQATMLRGGGAMLIDMCGNVVNNWRGLDGFPNKMLPGGHIMGSTGTRDSKYGFQDMLDLVQVDWEGNIVWKFDRYECIKDPRRQPAWMARQHHDYQREGNPVGYYVPGMAPLTDGGNTLILSHRNLTDNRISDKLLLDDVIIEVDWDGKVVWEWLCSERFDEMEFGEAARNTMYRNPNLRELKTGAVGDWMHINSMSRLGPNRWYDAGDERFHPDNIIWDGRETNITAITDKRTGRIVWQIGPEFTGTPALRRMGQIIGQHHAHMIPRGLPGEGNILVYDNGGWAGYGMPNPGSPTGRANALRDYSRVLEFDPTTLEITWQHTPREAGCMIPVSSYRFYSGFVSSAQRLPNGNTLITEGAAGRLLEVTREHELVWEYLSPYRQDEWKMGMVYRAYRLPYDWAPQAAEPEEKPIAPVDNSRFRVPGSPNRKPRKVTRLGGRGHVAPRGPVLRAHAGRIGD